MEYELKYVRECNAWARVPIARIHVTLVAVASAVGDR